MFPGSAPPGRAKMLRGLGGIGDFSITEERIIDIEGRIAIWKNQEAIRDIAQSLIIT